MTALFDGILFGMGAAIGVASIYTALLIDWVDLVLKAREWLR